MSSLNHLTDFFVSTRFHLESAIIGACLLEGGYARVGIYLQPHNFTDWSAQGKGNYQKYFSAISSLWPARSIDLITVTSTLPDPAPNDAYHLTFTTTTVNSLQHTSEHIFILLEMSLREQLTNISRRQLTGFTEDEKCRQLLIDIQEECADPDVDTFYLIEGIKSYLEQNKLSLDVIDDINNLVHSFEKNLTQIRRIATMEAIKTNLNHAIRQSAFGINDRIVLKRAVGALCDKIAEGLTNQHVEGNAVPDFENKLPV